MFNTEEVTFRRRRKSLPINTYSVGRRGKKAMSTAEGFVHDEGMDIFETLKMITTDPSIHLFSDLVMAKDSITNIAEAPTGLNQVERNKLSKAYKHLNQLGLVVRVKRGVYLINPRLSPPYPEYYEQACLHWIQLTGNNP